MKQADSPLVGALRHSAVAQAIAIAIVALLLRLLHIRFMIASPLFHAPTADEWENWSFAARLAQGNWLGEGLGPYFRPQFFAYVLAVLQKVTGGSVLACHLVLVLVDAATAGVLYLAARRLWPRLPALAAGLAWAAYSPALHFAATFNKESFGLHLQAWMLLTALLWLRAVKRGRPAWNWAALTGLLAGLGLLTRPAMLLPTVALFGVLAWTSLVPRQRKRRAAGPLALSAALVAVLIGAAAVRNFTIGGAPIIYSTNGWLNLYLANIVDGVALSRHSPGIAWDLLVERPTIERGITDFRGIDEYWKQRFLSEAAQDPGTVAGRVAIKAGQSLHQREIGSVANVAETRRLSPARQWAPGTGVLFPLALGGLILGIRRSPRAGTRRLSRKVMLLLAAASLVSVALVYPTSRDRLALAVALLPFTAELVLQLQHTLRAHRFGAVARRLALCGALAVAVNWPLPSGEWERFETWSTVVNRGDAHLLLWNADRLPRDLTESIAAYEEARGLAPHRLQPLKQLPAALVRAGKLAEAVQVQAELVSRLRNGWPENRGVRSRELEMLAQLAMRAGQPGVAERAALEWREADPGSITALDALAVSLLAQNRRPAARAIAEERYRRAPDEQALELLQQAGGTP